VYTISLAAGLAMAAVLLRAVLGKARNPAPLAATIRHLGLPRRFAWPAALLATSGEAGAAIAVLFRPDAAVTRLAIVALAGLFALAGLLALRLDAPVRCSCFGAGGDGYLGWRQILALMPWLAGVGVLRLANETAPPFAVAAARFAVVSLALAAVQGIEVWKARLQARGDRQSAQEMFRWLPLH
jgi:hypothetical protein